MRTHGVYVIPLKNGDWITWIDGAEDGDVVEEDELGTVAVDGELCESNVVIIYIEVGFLL